MRSDIACVCDALHSTPATFSRDQLEQFGMGFDVVGGVK
jgi:hypothetical protein